MDKDDAPIYILLIFFLIFFLLFGLRFNQVENLKEELSFYQEENIQLQEEIDSLYTVSEIENRCFSLADGYYSERLCFWLVEDLK